MRARSRLASVLLLSLLTRTSAFGQAGITVHIANGTTDNLIVTLYDRNLRHRQRVLSGEVINGNASIAITVTADASGRGHVAWTATTVDRDMRHCGHHDQSGLNDGETVHVHADGKCSRK
jgi:hypothetical protein